MIQSYSSKGLKELFKRGRSAKIRQDLGKRCIQILDAIDKAKTLDDLKLPGLRLHPDSRYKPVQAGEMASGCQWTVADHVRVE